MKYLRNLLYFVIGLLLSTWVVLSSAETIPATQTSNNAPTLYSSWGETFDLSAGCRAFVTAYYGNAYTSVTSKKVTAPRRNECQGSYYGAAVGDINGYNLIWKCTTTPTTTQNTDTPVSNCVVTSCPSGQNWTVSGNSCTRPDCVAPQTRQADGTCSAPPCPTYPPATPDSLSATMPSTCACPSGTAWFAYNGCRKSCGDVGRDANAGWDVNIPKGQSVGCFGGCEVQHKSGTFYTFKDGSTSAAATYTGWACPGNGVGTKPTADNQPQPDSPKLKDTDKKEPKCGAGEGVITSSSGNVLCVPPGTPNTSTPKVETQKKAEAFPDGSTKNTETTTTTDPYTGAKDVRSTATVTGTPSGTAGQAGAVGTTTSATNGGTTQAGSGSGKDGGECDPTKDFCGGPSTDGIYTKKDKQFSGPLTEFANGVKNMAITTTGAAFFNVSIPGAGCPSWQTEVPYLNVHISLTEVFCNPQAVAVLEIVGKVLMFVAAYYAFRIAFL